MKAPQFPRTWVVFSSPDIRARVRALPSFRVSSVDEGYADSIPVLAAESACTVVRAKGTQEGTSALIGASRFRSSDVQREWQSSGGRLSAKKLLNGVAGAYHYISLTPRHFTVLATTTGAIQTYYTEHEQ